MKPTNGAAMREKTRWDYEREVGQRIRCYRLIKGLTQQELADRLSLSPQQLQKYEKGYNRITAGTLCAIADAVDVSAGVLLVGVSDSDISPLLDRKTIEIVRAVKSIATAHKRRVVMQFLKGLSEW